MLEGLLQHDHPLTITGILRRMRTVNGRGRVLTLTQSGRTDATYEEVGTRVDWPSRALVSLGIRDGDRVATLITELPWDDESTGELDVRGPWIASAYFRSDDADEKFHDGWLRAGDVVAMDRDGYVRITDPVKDVIQSGGGWISSVELENEIMSHRDVAEAAVIGKPDERWSERPLACVVVRAGADVDAGTLVAHLRPRVAKWWIPDEYAFTDEVPTTSLGKFDKKLQRQWVADGVLGGRQRVEVGGEPGGVRAPVKAG